MTVQFHNYGHSVHHGLETTSGRFHICTAPRCSNTGFDHSATHLCLLLSDSRVKDVRSLHTPLLKTWKLTSAVRCVDQRKSPIQGGRWYTILPLKTLPHRTTQTQRYQHIQILADLIPPSSAWPSSACGS